jgi:hypothetical protein
MGTIVLLGFAEIALGRRRRASGAAAEGEFSNGAIAN